MTPQELTEEEGKRLYDRGWNSGFGWQDQEDFWREGQTPIYADASEREIWLSDLAEIRQEIAEELMREAAPEMFKALNLAKATIMLHTTSSTQVDACLVEIETALSKARGET